MGSLMRRIHARTTIAAALSLAALTMSIGDARADDPHGFLETVRKHVTLTSTVPANGAPNPYAIGHLLACNDRNGKVVELDPATGKRIYAQWVDANQAQSPLGNGDLFGMALRPDGNGFYYVEDDMNTVVEAR